VTKAETLVGEFVEVTCASEFFLQLTPAVAISSKQRLTKIFPENPVKLNPSPLFNPEVSDLSR
jgi:hypothetical protein